MVFYQVIVDTYTHTHTQTSSGQQQLTNQPTNTMIKSNKVCPIFVKIYQLTEKVKIVRRDEKYNWPLWYNCIFSKHSDIFTYIRTEAEIPEQLGPVMSVVVTGLLLVWWNCLDFSIKLKHYTELTNTGGESER